MMQAIIDIGSNSVRLAIFSGGNIIFRDKVTAKLGQGFYETLVIERDAIRRNLDAVKKLFDTAISRGVNKENIFIFATATVREAKNKADYHIHYHSIRSNRIHRGNRGLGNAGK